MTVRGKNTSLRACELEEIVELIRSEETGRTVSLFRKKWKAARLGIRQELVNKLPQLIFGGVYTKSRKTVYCGYVHLEINHLGSEEDTQSAKATLAACPHTLLAFKGAKERSAVFVMPYTLSDGTLPKDEEAIRMFHAHAYRHAVKAFEPMLGVAIELKEPSPQQLCLLGYDAEPYYNPQAVPVLIEQPTEMPSESVYQEQFEKLANNADVMQSVYDRHRYLAVQYELAFRQALEESGEELDRMDFKPIIVRVAHLCFGAGIGEEECVRWTGLHLQHFVGELEVRQTVGNVYDVADDFNSRLVTNKEMLRSLQLDEFMRRRYELRYNTMTDAPEYRERHSFCFEFRPVTKRVRNSIALNAQEEGLVAWDRDIDRYVCSDRLKDYAPIEDYLKRLPTWDGKDRIRPLMNRVRTDNPKWEELSYRWFLSMVAHWQGIDKNHGNALSPLLVGEQGCGKSTFCINILPPELKAYYTDSIDFSRKRDAEIYLSRFALINIDEFDQVSEQHQGFLKHLLQKPVVNVRKQYEKQVEALKRYASFIATSNHSDLLNDLSGNRRFICIKVDGVIDNCQPIEYEQLYAQAVAALKNNERYYLTHDEELALSDDNEAFRRRPIAEDLFHHYFRAATNSIEGTRMTAGEIYHLLQQKSKIALPQTKLSLFGRFLTKTVDKKFTTNSNRGTLYRVVEL